MDVVNNSVIRLEDGNDYVVPDMGYYDADKRTYAVHNYCDKRCTYEYQISTAEKTCPICPGDILYVRETWNHYVHDVVGGSQKGYHEEGYFYKASPEMKSSLPSFVEYHWGEKWKPSIHMPKEAARIFLKVKDVRVERLQDITDEGAYREGAGDKDVIYQTGARVLEFARLWDSTIKKSDIEKYGWSANPWVWVIEFERCEKPEEWK